MHSNAELKERVALLEATLRKQEEAEAEKLFQSESLYRSILKASPDNITIADMNGCVRMASPSGLAMFGYSCEEDVIGLTITEFLVPEDRQHAQVVIEQLHNGILTGPSEYRGVRTDGSVFDIEVNAEFIRNTAQEPTGMIFIARDISERKRAEKALRESESLYRSILKASPDIIAITDMDYRIRMASPSTFTMFGYMREEDMLGHLIIDFIVPEDREIVVSSLAIMQKGIFTGPEQFRGLRSDGTVFDIEANGRFISDTNGQHTGVIFIVRNISERKRAEAERERLIAAIEQVAETVVITDSEGTIQYANPAFERITGYSRNEALGQNPRILKSGKHDEAFYKAIWDTLVEGKTWEGRFINKRKDGGIFIEEATISPVRDTSGAIINYVAVKRDITRELKTEQQLLQAQRMESVGRLAGGVAHDFNNLLTVIINYAEICQNNIPKVHPIRTWLEEITNASQRSADITRQLLTFARKQTIIPKIVDLNEVVAKMLKLLHRMIGENIKLVWVPGLNIWPVKIDPSQIDQILANLCINARDAISSTGRIIIETENALLSDASNDSFAGVPLGDYVLLTITDDGCGMEKDILEQIFDPFFTTKEVGKGTGLGLATVYGIVKQNNGLINVSSEPGKGTTFKIYLPRFTGESEETATESKQKNPRGHGETILLVEDDKSLRQTCEILLDTLGYTVVGAENPAVAQEIFVRHSEDIHLLMTDIIMPGLDGRELAKRLSAIKPELKVVYMSGYTSDVIGQYMISEEGLHFLAKPFTLSNLAFKVNAALAND